MEIIKQILLPAHLAWAILNKIMQNYNIAYLFVCEAGSTAMGLAGPTSDHDIRGFFIPLNSNGRPDLRNFMGLKRRIPEVIELKNEEVDLVLYDLFKVIQLLISSNPTVMEWMKSSIVLATSPCIEKLRLVAKNCFNPKASWYHNLNLMKSNHLSFVANEERVKPKKLIYVMPSMLAMLFIEKKGEQPPLNFDELLALCDDIPANVKDHVDLLVQAKREGVELVARDPVLDAFIVEHLARKCPSTFKVPENHAKELEAIWFSVLGV